LIDKLSVSFLLIRCANWLENLVTAVSFVHGPMELA